MTVTIHDEPFTHSGLVKTNAGGLGAGLWRCLGLGRNLRDGGHGGHDCQADDRTIAHDVTVYMSSISSALRFRFCDRFAANASLILNCLPIRNGLL